MPSKLLDHGSSFRTLALRYVAVGGLAAVVDLGAFHLIEPHLRSTIAAATMSFLVAAAVNYSLSAIAVYRTPWLAGRRALMFLTFNACGLAVNVIVTAAVASLAAPISATIAKVVGIGVAFGVNFTLNTFVVFKDP